MVKKVVSSATLGDKFQISGTLGKFTAQVDQPAAAGGDDTAPTPLDYMLFSIAACQATIARIVAMQKQIDLRAYSVEIEGELETDVLLGKSTSARCGFSSINVKVTIDADLSAEEKQQFAEEVDRRCPVSENVQNTTPLHLEVA